ncbi:MAG: TonB-dependent receptor, partial [Leptospiraceae bacterium]|nr:TonB-dependent receptor [Leptospiraceae bacterium]
MTKKLIIGIAIFLSFSQNIFSQDDPPSKKDTKPTKEEMMKKWEEMSKKTSINVIGDGKDSLKKIPGSATLIDKKTLEETQPIDAMEVMRRVPGASIRYMDSAGLTPNISFRGVSNEESRKTLFLEDGVLTSLSPYGQPESYYFPNIDRMERVEVVKGSGSILFGPSTIGGIINFVTRKPPLTPKFTNKTIGGENGYFSNLMQYGGTWGKTAVDVSYMHKKGNGYRDYNAFHANDIYMKLIHQFNDSHTVTMKIGHNDQKAQASYHGLTQGLYWKNYRINPARFDRKEVSRDSIVLGHEFQISENNKLITKAYATGARRDWQREDFGYNNLNQFGRASIPPATDLFATYAPGPIGNRPGDIMYMRGTAPMRNQGFSTAGIETKLESKFTLLEMTHELDVGLRAHGERNKINFKQNYSPLNYPFVRDGFPYSQQNRAIRAYAAYIQDRISITQKFKIIPGVRYEYVSQGVYTTRRKSTARDVTQNLAARVGDVIFVDKGTESYTKIALPGFGVTYDITNSYTWFAGAHKSFSP